MKSLILLCLAIISISQQIQTIDGYETNKQSQPKPVIKQYELEIIDVTHGKSADPQNTSFISSKPNHFLDEMFIIKIKPYITQNDKKVVMSLKVTKNDTIQMTKQLIQHAAGLPAERLNLYKNTKKLSDNQTLGELCVQPYSYLFYTISLRKLRIFSIKNQPQQQSGHRANLDLPIRQSKDIKPQESEFRIFIKSLDGGRYFGVKFSIFVSASMTIKQVKKKFKPQSTSHQKGLT